VLSIGISKGGYKLPSLVEVVNPTLTGVSITQPKQAKNSFIKLDFYLISESLLRNK
jgi:hypothetical protein